MRLVVVYEGSGEIVSVMRAEPAPADAPQFEAGPWPERGERVVELDDAPDDLAKLAPTEIAERYHIDTKAGSLMAGPPPGDEERDRSGA